MARPTNYKEFSESGHDRERSSTDEIDEHDEQEHEDSDQTGKSQNSTSADSNTISFNKHGSGRHAGSGSSDREQYNTSAEQESDQESRSQSESSTGETSDLITTKASRGGVAKQHVTPSIHALKHGKQSTAQTIKPRSTPGKASTTNKNTNLNSPAETPRRSKKSRKQTTMEATPGGSNEHQDKLELGVNPEEDDLDEDKTPQGKRQNIDHEQLTKGARPKSIIKRKNSRHTEAKPTTSTTITPKKQKLSVAKRLASLNTPTNILHIPINNKNTHLTTTGLIYDDESFQIERQRAERDRIAAEQMLLHSQREAELAKQRLEAEETRKKAIQLQKETQKDNRKAEQERARYEKTSIKNNNISNNRCPASKSPKKRTTVEQQVQKAKDKAKKLNPLRRARSLFVDTAGNNNPNVDGQDNGMNAWLDFKLNNSDMDAEFKHDVTYAKRNSDNNRFYNIDDVPIRGPQGPPPIEDDIQSVISISEATEMANALLNQDNLVICRNTGMLRRKNEKVGNDDNRRRQPTSTVTRAEQPKRTDNRHKYGNAGREANRYRQRYSERQYDDHNDHETNNIRFENSANVGWDTDVELISDDDGYPPNNNNDNRHVEQPTNVDCDSYRYHDYGRDSNNRHDGRSQHYDNRSRRSHNEGHNDNRRSNNKGNIAYLDTSSSDSSPARVRKIKSVINAKPTSSVCEQMKYPQFSLGQISGYTGKNIRYEHLTYEQFMAGELLTISNTQNPMETKGRTELLRRIATWRLRTNVTWAQVRQAFTHIVRKVEDHEITWRVNWDEFERRIYDRVELVNNNTTQNRTRRTATTEPVWFCKLFQRPEGCNREAPHSGKIGGQYKQLHHICASCWLCDRIKKAHPKCSSECPNKEQ